MPLFNTIAHPSAPTRQESWGLRRRLSTAGVVASIALVGVIGFLVVSSGDEGVPTAGALTQATNLDDFLRINTTDLEFAGTGVAPAAASPQLSKHFLRWNTSAFDGLAAAKTATGPTSSFYQLNTTALEYPPPPYVEPAAGPR